MGKAKLLTTNFVSLSGIAKITVGKLGTMSFWKNYVQTIKNGSEFKISTFQMKAHLKVLWSRYHNN